MLEGAGLDPSFLVGGDLNESGSGARSGAGDLFVFEADESDGSFLLASHGIGIVTNVDVDHVDFYPGGRDEIEAAFAEFMTRCESVVACGDDAGRPLGDRTLAGRSAVTYGTDRANDWTARDRCRRPGRGSRARDRSRRRRDRRCPSRWTARTTC